MPAQSPSCWTDWDADKHKVSCRQSSTSNWSKDGKGIQRRRRRPRCPERQNGCDTRVWEPGTQPGAEFARQRHQGRDRQSRGRLSQACRRRRFRGLRYSRGCEQGRRRHGAVARRDARESFACRRVSASEARRNPRIRARLLGVLQGGRSTRRSRRDAARA